MGSKRKFKRDYIILESKDANFRYKERVLPKAFAKVEVNDEKSIVALYVENLKYMKDGYKVVAIRSDYETIDLGKVVLSEQGKGEFVLDLEDRNAEIKGIAILYERVVPLIGFKGSKIDNYEEILFMGEDEEYEEYEEYEEIEYIEDEELDESDKLDEPQSEQNNEDELDEEIEYIEDVEDEFIEEYEYIDEYEEYEEIEDDTENHNYEEIDNYEEIQDYNHEITRKNKSEGKKTHNTSNQVKTTNNKPINNQPHNVSNKPRNTHSQAINNTGTLLMPRQIKKGLKYFKEVKPFVTDSIEDTRWWKIEINPTTLCGCVMPYLGYVNTLNYTMYSDAVMNSYKYRHYLFGVQYDEYNKRKNYIYAVPGSKDEQPDNGNTGFNAFQPCDNRNNSLGYWLCFIDSRYRRIVK